MIIFRNDELEDGRQEESDGEEYDERELKKVADLKARYRQLSAASVSRRRSISPERKSSRSRRSYKQLPLCDDGLVDLPVILGRGVHRTTLIQIGKVEDGNFQTDHHIYPVGFQAKRKYFTFDSNLAVEKPKKVYYYCAIKKNDNQPLFEVSIGGPASAGDDDEENSNLSASASCELLESDGDLQKLWQHFKARFSSQLQIRLEEDFASPEVFFGLEHESLSRHIKELASKNVQVSL